MGKLLVLSGPSGVGKTTVVNRLLSQSELERVVTATTRSPRSGEQHGRDYLFLSEDEFCDRVRRQQFLEHAIVHGHRYGTPRDTVEEGLRADRTLVLNIDVQGGRQLREAAAGLPVLSVFLLPPSLEDLERRLRDRATEGDKEVQDRLRAAKEELKEQIHYDYRVVNDHLDRAVKEILKLLEQAE